MKVVLVFVTSLDGKVTRWEDPDVGSWSSDEDKSHFRELWNSARIVIMGSATYEAAEITPSEKRKIIVLTQRVSDYKSKRIKGQIEFSDETPERLIGRLAESGCSDVLLVGGAHLATSFFKENLIDEIIITVEPKIFGSGGNFVTEKPLDINLNLIDLKKVNERGTLILHYSVNKEQNSDHQNQ